MSYASVSALSDETLERIADATSDVFPHTIAACVFGSAARGEMRPFSDVDLAVLLPDEPDLMDMGELAGRRADWALRYGLVESIQIIIDLACQVVARRNLASPTTYRECIEALAGARHPVHSA